MTEQEIFVDIHGFEGEYQVSNLGNVKSLRRELIDKLGRKRVVPEKILINRLTKKGYHEVILKGEPWKTHRLVAMMFIPNPENKLYVSRIDGDKANNIASNLMWSTHSEIQQRVAYENSLKTKEYTSKYIGKTIQGFLILDKFYEINSGGNKTAKFTVQCVHCNKNQSRQAVKITHGNACCDCQKGFKERFTDRSTRLGSIYHGMLQRCENPNLEGYSSYGGKGVSVCDEWQTFPPFKKWSLENGYKDHLSIDRIDFDGNYEPNNCRWVNGKVQANNKSDNHLLTFNGKTQNIQQWGEELDIKPNTILTRIRRGWSTEKSLTTRVT